MQIHIGRPPQTGDSRKYHDVKMRPISTKVCFEG